MKKNLFSLVELGFMQILGNEAEKRSEFEKEVLIKKVGLDADTAVSKESRSTCLQ